MGARIMSDPAVREQEALLPADPPPPLGERDFTPLSVLQATRGPWQARKKQWTASGIDHGDGRDHITEWPTITPEEGIRWQRKVSVFDPVLTELLYTWYTRPGDTILDPFAGGPVRALVAAHLGRDYIGIDISPRQLEANRARAADWEDRGLLKGSITWLEGPAQDVLPAMTSSVDYVIACPPYHDLERYTDHPADLSAMTWDDFRATLAQIVTECGRLLRADRYATWITGDVRDRRGHLRRLPAHVDAAHEDAGLPLINDQVLAGPLGGKYGVIWRSWAGRSATRIHQYVHTYVRGDRRKAAARLREEAR